MYVADVDGSGIAGVQIVGLARVSTRDCAHDDGPLTCWSEAGMMQREHYNNPSDGYELIVEDIMQFTRGPQHMALRQGKLYREDGVSAIRLNQPIFIGPWGDVPPSLEVRRVGGKSVGSTSAAQSVSQVLCSWAIDGDGSELPCFLVPFPLPACC